MMKPIPLFITIFLIFTLGCSAAEPLAGASQTAAEDGMEMVYIPAGSFNMGSLDHDSMADIDELPIHKVSLDGYWIDKTEITNAMYRVCVASGGCTPPAHSRHYSLDIYDNHPVIGISWDQANAYCGWAGRRLPTEAEWEKAARGTDGRIYPWGNTLPSYELANFDQLADETEPVGTHPNGASPYGALDMAGNAWEWVSDGYSPDYYSISPIHNPISESPVNRRVLRGGNWDSNAEGIRSANRFWAFPGRNDTDGFRCANSD